MNAGNHGLGLYFADYLATFALGGRLELRPGRAGGLEATVALPLG
jgi:hypothetical protein